MKITIDIKTDNAAFGEGYHEELNRILSKTIHAIVNDTRDGNLRDLNGNAVGKFTVKGK